MSFVETSRHVLELIALKAQEVRRLQRAYYGGEKEVLTASKQAERQLDTMLYQAENNQPIEKQEELF